MPVERLPGDTYVGRRRVALLAVAGVDRFGRLEGDLERGADDFPFRRERSEGEKNYLKAIDELLRLSVKSDSLRGRIVGGFFKAFGLDKKVLELGIKMMERGEGENIEAKLMEALTGTVNRVPTVLRQRLARGGSTHGLSEAQVGGLNELAREIEAGNEFGRAKLVSEALGWDVERLDISPRTRASFKRKVVELFIPELSGYKAERLSLELLEGLHNWGLFGEVPLHLFFEANFRGGHLGGYKQIGESYYKERINPHFAQPRMDQASAVAYDMRWAEFQVRQGQYMVARDRAIGEINRLLRGVGMGRGLDRRFDSDWFGRNLAETSRRVGNILVDPAMVEIMAYARDPDLGRGWLRTGPVENLAEVGRAIQVALDFALIYPTPEALSLAEVALFRFKDLTTGLFNIEEA